MLADAASLECFSLFGHSQGGAIAVKYAVRHPERVPELSRTTGSGKARPSALVTIFINDAALRSPLTLRVPLGEQVQHVLVQAHALRFRGLRHFGMQALRHSHQELAAVGHFIRGL